MRAADWDERYAEDRQWAAEPDLLVAELLENLPPGRAVDLAAGEGRHALWLAGRGWRVTAVDFSGAGLARGRVQPGTDAVTWVPADVLERSAAPVSLDLVLVAYLHLPERDMRLLLERAVGWLRPGGRLLVLGHDVHNIVGDVGGPQDPALLHSVDRLARVAARLDVDRLERVARETPAGTALDTLLWGGDPAEPSAGGGSVPSRDGDGWSGRTRRRAASAADRRRAGAGAGPRRGCGRLLPLLRRCAVTGSDEIDAWFAQAGAREAELRRVDELVMAAAPGIDRQLVPTGSGAMLGYGLMPYRPRSARRTMTWPLIALAAQKRHLSQYVCAVVEGQYLAEARAGRLGTVSCGKSCIRFTSPDGVDAPPPDPARALGPWPLLFRHVTVSLDSERALRVSSGRADRRPASGRQRRRTSMVLTALPPVADLSVRSALTRLSAEFPELGHGSIGLVVRTCREELRGSPDGALPELVERLARQRLRAPAL